MSGFSNRPINIEVRGQELSKTGEVQTHKSRHSHVGSLDSNRNLLVLSDRDSQGGRKSILSNQDINFTNRFAPQGGKTSYTERTQSS